MIDFTNKNIGTFDMVLPKGIKSKRELYKRHMINSLTGDWSTGYCISNLARMLRIKHTIVFELLTELKEEGKVELRECSNSKNEIVKRWFWCKEK